MSSWLMSRTTTHNHIRIVQFTATFYQCVCISCPGKEWISFIDRNWLLQLCHWIGQISSLRWTAGYRTQGKVISVKTGMINEKQLHPSACCCVV